MDTPIPAALPDAGAVLRACFRLDQSGHQVLTLTTHDAVMAAGVRIRFRTSATRDNALRVLRSLGYAARSDDPGEAVLVTGWDDEALALRTAILEQTVAQLIAEYGSVSATALATYRLLVDTAGHDPADAENLASLEAWTAANCRPEVTARACGELCVHQPVDPADLHSAPESARALLVRIAAADRTLLKLPWVYSGTVHGVIALWNEYRDRRGRDDTAAAAAALHDVKSVTDTCLAIATSDIPVHGGLPDALDGDDLKAAHEAQCRVWQGDHRKLEERLTTSRITNRVSAATYDLCRRCGVQLIFAQHGAAALWFDGWGDRACSDGREHQPFPGAYEPNPA